LHQLRHRYATVAYQATHDLLLVRDYMGHESTQTTAGYAKINPQAPGSLPRRLRRQPRRDVVTTRQAAHGHVHADHGKPLTDREAEVLQVVADGLSNKEAAVRLELSAGTVKSHLAPHRQQARQRRPDAHGGTGHPAGAIR